MATMAETGSAKGESGGMAGDEVRGEVGSEWKQAL